MSIDRRLLFTEAWKSARATRSLYRTLRTAFAAALRRLWPLIKATAEMKAQAAFRKTHAPATAWEQENPYRARAVAARKARLGSYCINCW